MMQRPADRVRVEPVTRRDSTISEYAVRVWYPFEGWGTIHSRHPSEGEANTEAERIRPIINKEHSDGAKQPRP